MPVSESAVGAVLTIPDKVLTDIKDAEKYIKQLDATSRQTAKNIKGHFDNTAVSGLNTFIRKIQEAQNKLGSIKMPEVKSKEFTDGISEIATAMSTIDKSVNTGAGRIVRIADAVSKLSASTPAYSAFKDIADGITLIGRTSDQTIAKVSSLAASMASLAKDIRTVSAARAADSSSTANASEINRLFKEQAELIRQRNALEAHGSQLTMKEREHLDSIIKRYDEIEKQLNKIYSKKQTSASRLAFSKGDELLKGIDDPTNAIQAAKNAKSLKELQEAYKNLKSAMDSVKPNSAIWLNLNKAYKETKNRIEDIKKAMGDLRNASRSTNDALGGLRNSLIGAFSIAAIKNYISKMIDVRKEFELQNVALRAILQNKDEADRIFLQVQQMALQSPFTIMQLTTYTKQLAAYRIEADKLVGTTKMLADVSAGLGVDMSRLILAFGQVKAANFLRATEVRQFTEAGLNIAGELAQYFSELQGKMVSVGDVMDMVTKRMVRFEDVEEVFKRVTSAGGLFYDMQRKQSESLYGQIQRITDAADIMFNDIGRSNQGLLSNVLTSIRSIIENWRSFVIWIKTAAAAFGTFYTYTKFLAPLALNIRNAYRMMQMYVVATNSATASTQRLSAAMKRNAFGLILSAVSALIAYIWEACTASDALTESIDRIDTDINTDISNAVYRFKQLADIISSTTASYKEQQEAMEEIGRSYKDILPQQVLEIEHIKSLAGNYDNLTESIKMYYEAKRKEQKKDAIDSEYENKIQKQAMKIAEMTFGTSYYKNNLGREYNFLSMLTSEGINANQSQINDITKKWAKDWADGMYSNSEKAFKNLFVRLGQFYDTDMAALVGKYSSAYYSKNGMANMMGLFADIDEVISEYKDKMSEINDTTTIFSTKKEQDEFETLERERKGFEDTKKSIQEYTAALSNLYNLNQQGKLLNATGDGFIDKGAEKAIEDLNKMRTLMGMNELSAKQLGEVLANTFEMQAHLRGVSQFQLEGVFARVQEAIKPLQTQVGKRLLQSIQNEMDSIDGSNVQKTIRRTIDEFVNLRGASKETFDFLTVSANNSFKDVRSSVSGQIKLLEEQLTEYKRIMSSMALTDEGKRKNIADILGAEFDPETVKQSIAMLRAFELAIGGGDKKTGRGKDPWAARVSLFKELNTEYEKLLKNYSKEESMRRITSSYGDAVSAIFKDQGKFADISNWIGFDKASMIKMGEDMLSSLSITDEQRKKLEKSLAELRATVDIEIQEDAVKDFQFELNEMIDSFRATKELDSLNLPINLMYMLGGKPTTLEDMRNKLDSFRELFMVDKAYGDEGVKAWEEMNKQISKMENDALKERIKNYGKFVQQAYTDQAQIMIKSYQDLIQMRADFQKAIDEAHQKLASSETSAGEKSQLTKQIDVLRRQMSAATDKMKADMQKNVAKNDWNIFKGSAFFESMYKDLDGLSGKTIDALLVNLERVRGKLQSMADVDPKAIREVTQYIEKLKDAKIQINPFKEAWTNLKEIKRLESEGWTREGAYDRMIGANNRLMDIESQINDTSTLLGLQERGVDIEANKANLTEQQQQIYKNYGPILKSYLESLYQQKNTTKEVADEASGVVDKYEAARNALVKSMQQLSMWEKYINDIAKATISMVETTFGPMDDTTKQIVQSILDAGTAAVQLIIQFELMGVALNTALGIVGWISIALTAVASVLGAIFGNHDKALQEQIEDTQRSIKKLERSLGKLKTAIDESFAFSSMIDNTKLAEDNINRQIQSYRQMIELEKSKKDTDSDKIQEWENAIEDLEEQLVELREAEIEAFGGFGSAANIKSAAQEFADAWVDAYMETGDGLDALNDKFKDFAVNMLKKQIWGRLAERYINPILESIDRAFDASGAVDPDKWNKAIMALKNINLEDFNEQAKEIADALNLRDLNGTSNLSDLQKGIQNITEPQAAAIEAYLNSMRFEVFKHTEQLQQLVLAVQAQYDTQESPMYQEVVAIRSILGDIQTSLDRVIISTNVGDKGYAIKIR